MNNIKIKSQLFVDISTIVNIDHKTGIQRVVRSILIEMLDNPPYGYSVEPVYYVISKGFYYARDFTQTYIESLGDIAFSNVIIDDHFKIDINNWNSTFDARLEHLESALKITGTGSPYAAAEQLIKGFSVGKRYELEILATSVSGMIDVLLIMGGVWHATINPTEISGIHKFRFTAIEEQAGIHLRVIGGTDSALFDYVKIREIVGDRLAEKFIDEKITFDASDIFLGLDLTAQLFPEINATIEQFKNIGMDINYLVYDLTPLTIKEVHTEGMITSFSFWIDSIIQYSNKLICISNAVATDFKALAKEKKYKVIPKIEYFHLGGDIDSSNPTMGLPFDALEVLSELESKPSFLMVGTIEPRKQVSQVLSAFELLWREGVDVNLVIVGKEGWQVDEVVSRILSSAEYGKHLIWLKNVSDEYLDKVYSSSAALIFASIAEGFGLPLIESAMHGTPIIARDLPVFKEVAGEHAFYFSGLSAESLAHSINQWLTLSADNKAPTVQGMKWLTWRESTVDLLRLVVSK